MHVRPFVLAALAAMGASPAFAKTCEIDIAGNDAMQFDKKELVVAPDCTDVKLTLKHTGKLPKSAMGHNWILTAPGDLQALTGVATAAGPANDYVPKGDQRVLAAASLVGGGETTTVTFKLADL